MEGVYKMALKILTRPQAEDLKNKTIAEINGYKGRLDSLENSEMGVENQSKQARINQARLKALKKDTKRNILMRKKKLNKINTLLAKGKISNEGDEFVIQEVK